MIATESFLRIPHIHYICPYAQRRRTAPLLPEGTHQSEKTWISSLSIGRQRRDETRLRITRLGAPLCEISAAYNTDRMDASRAI